MTLAYVPGDSAAHRLDPRTKLAFQGAFATAAVVHPTPAWLAALTIVALGALALAGTSPRMLGEFRGVVPLLVAAPAIEALALGPPWIVPADAVGPALASYRVVLVLAVSAAYVRSTPVRDSRAAVQWLVPGRTGAFLGLGVSFVLRFLPVLRADLGSIRAAMAARLGDERSIVDRLRLVGTTGLRRLFHRSDRFALALRARCFAWNPTLPPLAFGRVDVVGLAAAIALAGATVLGVVR